MSDRLPAIERCALLSATQDEIDRVTAYVESQASDSIVEFVQKVYSETVLSVHHDIWDIHTDADRWWVITPPMNLYKQSQFPNMDLALTFHVGLCVRVPRSEAQAHPQTRPELFVECLRGLQEGFEALKHAEEVGDYQSIGVRCREALLSLINVSRTLIPWEGASDQPQAANLKAWSEHICAMALSGDSRKNRRQLFRTLLVGAWDFSNWLTHTKSSNWHDAEAALGITESAIGFCISAISMHVRGAPEQCPACGSHRLSPERGVRSDVPGAEWERPTCDKCDWVGVPVLVDPSLAPHQEAEPTPPEGECITQTVPLRRVDHP